ncbi:MAG: hypothetical protein RM368_00370 [Nostoc sp. DedSLP03]|nr:hypothetical protein [Nostoc sp. DedSLP03]MDZ7963425.1 hypothetical protein [Nostoc sp. DedSLP03]
MTNRFGTDLRLALGAIAHKTAPPKTSGEYFGHQLKRLQSGLGDFSHKS